MSTSASRFGHELLCHGLAGWLKDKVPPEVHAQIAPKLHALHALAAAGKIPPERRQGESDRLREPGELVHEGPDGLPVAMDAWIAGLPRHLFGFRQSDFGQQG
jgi:hypothetical protein